MDDHPTFSERIAWDKGEPERWRIIYEKIWTHGNHSDVQIALMEASIEIRVKARRFLPNLVRAVAEVASLGQDNESSAAR